jgi:hypothetical protein
LFLGCTDTGVPGKSKAVDLNTQAVVFYTSDVAVQIVAAAVVGAKYAQTTYYDIDGMDSAAMYGLITAIDTGSYHKIFIACDTSKRTLEFVDNKIKGSLWQYELTDALHSGVSGGVVPAAAPTIITASATKSKSEICWEAVNSTKTPPLIVQYTDLLAFSATRGTANTAYTDTTIRDAGKSWVADAYIGDKVYIVAGTGIGQSGTIFDNTSTILYSHPAWAITPTSTTQYVVKKAGEEDELFYDKYTELYILTYLWDLDNSEVLVNWGKLLNNPQDLDLLWNTVIPYGKAIFDYSCL